MVCSRKVLAAVVLIAVAGCGGSSSTEEVETDSLSQSPQTAPEVTEPAVASAPTEAPDTAAAVTTSVEEPVSTWPRARAYHEAVYDGGDDSVLVVGGCTGPNCAAINEIWSFDPHGSVWTERSRVRFMSPAGGPVVYDAESDLVIALQVVFADVSSGSIGTWIFDRVNDVWTELAADPQPRLGVGARMVYDSNSDRVIAFGGQGFDDGELVWTEGTWAYDANTNTWTDMQPTVVPPPINYFAFSYDSESDRSVLFGLQDGGDTLMWSYDYDANTWEQIERTGGPSHAPAYARSFYHPATDRIVYFGGWGPSETNPDMHTQNQVWAFDLNTNSWEDLGRNDIIGPIAWHTMTYVETIGRAIVFGGGTSYYEYTGNRLFSYDPTNNEWIEILPA